MSVSSEFTNNWIIEQQDPPADITSYWRRSNPRRFSKITETPLKHSPCNVVLPDDILFFKIFPLAIQSALFKEPSSKLFGKLSLLSKKMRSKLDTSLETLSKVTFGDPCNETQKNEKCNLAFFSKYGKTARDLRVAFHSNKTLNPSNLEILFKECSGITVFSLIECEKVSSLTFIQFASNLTVLKIDSVSLSTYDLEPCTHLRNLNSLTVILKNPGSHLDITVLTRCQKLNALVVRCSKVSGLTPMFNHPSLEKIVFNHVKILEGINRTASQITCRKKTPAEKKPINVSVMVQTTCQQTPVHQTVVNSQFSLQSPDI